MQSLHIPNESKSLILGLSVIVYQWKRGERVALKIAEGRRNVPRTSGEQLDYRI